MTNMDTGAQHSLGEENWNCFYFKLERHTNKPVKCVKTNGSLQDDDLRQSLGQCSFNSLPLEEIISL